MDTRSRSSNCRHWRSVAPAAQTLLVAVLLLLPILAGSHGGVARAAAVCSPLGGAPGPLAGLGAESGNGSIGPGASPIGGQSPDDFVADLVGASPSPPMACQAPDPRAAGAAEPASLPAEVPGASAGNPVNLVTGNKYERRIDVVMPDPESGMRAALAQALGDDALRVLGAHWPAFVPLELIFSRHYNSRFDPAGPLGPGWRHGFETALARLRGRHGIEIQIIQADGRRLVFRRSGREGSGAGGAEPGSQPMSGGSRVAPREAAAETANAGSPSSFSGGQASDGVIDEDLGTAMPWRWRWPDGRIVSFDGDGRLARIEAPDRDHIAVQRDQAGRVRALIDAYGRQLQLEYLGKRLHALVLPDGNRIGYDYDRHGVLVAVRYPDGRDVRYRYDDPRAFHLLTSIELPGGSSSRYNYDDALRVVESVPAHDPREALSFEYRLSESGGATGATVVRQGERTSTWQWEVDERGRERVVSMSGEPCTSCPVLEAPKLPAISPSTAVRPGAAEAASSAYSRSEQRSEAEIELQRDAFGLPSEARIRGFARSSDGRSTPIGIHVRWQRHLAGPLAGKLSWVERVGPDGVAARTSFFHDSRRALVTVVQPGALIHRFERDRLGRASAQQRADRARLESHFDGFWRPVSSRMRGEVTDIEWGVAGRPASIAWPSGERWTLRWRTDGVEVESNRGWIARSGDPPAGRGDANASGSVSQSGGVITRSDASAGAGDSAGAGGRSRTSGSASGGATSTTGPGPARGAAVALVLGGSEPTVVDAAGRRTRYLYDDFGRLVEVDSSVSGYRRLRHDAWGRVVELDSPLGVIERRRYDLAGRLVEREQIEGAVRIVTRFEWEGALLVGVEHPVQGTRVEHDDAGRVVAIQHRLLGAPQRWTFERDARGRLVAQAMPDGSRLLYRYDDTGRPAAMLYASAGSKPVTIVDTVAYQDWRATSWRFGNGIGFRRDDDPSGKPLKWRWLGAGPLPQWRYRWRSDGLPAAIEDRDGERRLAWDAFGRLIVDERHRRAPEGKGRSAASEYFAWDLAGDLRLAKRVDDSVWRSEHADPQHDALGRPLRHGEFELRYGAEQRIVAVERGSLPIARYRYNAAGERSTKSSGNGIQGFLYRNRRLVAETDSEGRITRHYLYWLGHPVALVERRGGESTVSWLHGDHLGTPHAATDAFGRLIWAGRYEAFGRLSEERGNLHQPLRFAGQYHDRETGLHDNYLRTYDPAAARYLEPDPLGLPAGLNPRAYADGNPVLGTDPLGLILFAFDGTNNGDPAPGNDDISNVRKFFQLYMGDRWYMTGVGLDDPDSGIKSNAFDAIDANTARARVDYMFSELDAYLDDRWIGQTIDLDVVGFSRGAAMARDFVNRVQHFDDERYWFAKGICINLRFLGIWDTVAQFGSLGRDNHRWRLAIPTSVGAAYHAIALNEHRSLFPLERATGAAVIERGFIGSHADVGGGNAEGDLSDISLVWMARMAAQAGINLDTVSSENLVVSSPILHDRNDILGDRDVILRDRNGTVAARSTQRTASIAGMNWVESNPFLVMYPNARLDASDKPSIAGEVNMQAYADWLRAEYSIDISVP